MLSQPAASLSAQGEMHSPVMEQAGRQAARCWVPGPGGSSPACDSSWQARSSILPCLPGCVAKSWSNPPVVFQKRHTNFCRVGSAESR